MRLSLAVRTPLVAAAVFVAATSAAFAHPGHDEIAGLSSGILHPLTGVDHILAMVTVGLFAAHLGGRALWLVPSSFMAMMAFGGVLGVCGVDLPFVETGIALSVVVLGLAVALQASLPLAGAMAMVGAFAIFHGHAHGAEMPLTGSAAPYVAGFLAATALLHAAGVAFGLGLARLPATALSRVSRIAGGGIAAAGVGLLLGAF